MIRSARITRVAYWHCALQALLAAFLAHLL
jgi:hypothetical protein